MSSNEKKEYELINLGFEYPGMTGGARWAVITDLDIHELEERYRDELSIFKPYVVMTTEQGKAIREYEQNEKKHSMRSLRHHDLFGYEEGTTEYIHSVFSDNEPEEKTIDKLEYEKVREAIEKLPEIQKRRCILYFYHGLSETEIAKLEGVSRSSVRDSLNWVLKKLKKLL